MAADNTSLDADFLQTDFPQVNPDDASGIGLCTKRPDLQGDRPRIENAGEGPGRLLPG